MLFSFFAKHSSGFENFFYSFFCVFVKVSPGTALPLSKTVDNILCRNMCISASVFLFMVVWTTFISENDDISLLKKKIATFVRRYLNEFLSFYS
jgi:hypothetical protein